MQNLQARQFHKFLPSGAAAIFERTNSTIPATANDGDKKRRAPTGARH